MTIHRRLFAVQLAAAVVLGASAALATVTSTWWLTLTAAAGWVGLDAARREYTLLKREAAAVGVRDMQPDLDLEALADVGREARAVHRPPFHPGWNVAPVLPTTGAIFQPATRPRPDLRAVDHPTGRHAVELVATQTMPAVTPKSKP